MPIQSAVDGPSMYYKLCIANLPSPLIQAYAAESQRQSLDQVQRLSHRTRDSVDLGGDDMAKTTPYTPCESSWRLANMAIKSDLLLFLYFYFFLFQNVCMYPFPCPSSTKKQEG